MAHDWIKSRWINNTHEMGTWNSFDQALTNTCPKFENYEGDYSLMSDKYGHTDYEVDSRMTKRYLKCLVIKQQLSDKTQALGVVE